jgi:hypothetical protein
MVPLGVGIFRLPMPVRFISDLREASRTGTGLVNRRSNVKKGEFPLTQAEAPESINTVSSFGAEVSMALTRTGPGFDNVPGLAGGVAS